MRTLRWFVELLSGFMTENRTMWDRELDGNDPIVGTLWDRIDVMPKDACNELDLPQESSFAQGSRRLKAMLSWPQHGPGGPPGVNRSRVVAYIESGIS